MRIFNTGARAALVCGALTLALSARADFGFSSFAAGDIGSGANQFTLNGNAAINGSAIRLVPAQFGQAGTAFYNTRQSILDNFSVAFDYDMFGGSEADGLTLLFSDSVLGVNALGIGGTGLGYTGIDRTLAVEFDTFADEGIEVRDGVGNSYGAIGIPRADLRGPHSARIDFSGASGVGTLSVYQDNTLKLTASVDLNGFASGSGLSYIGFSGATGALDDNHDIKSASFTGTRAVPEPATIVLIGVGALSLIARRRR